MMNKCDECHYDGQVMQWKDSPCVCCIHNKVKDNFKPKQWQPKHTLLCNTTRIDARTRETDIVLKMMQDTEEQAEDLAKRFDQLATLHAWASEHGYLEEWDEDKDNERWFVYEGVKGWSTTWCRYHNDSFSILMTKEGAEATAKALNSGVLVL